MEYIILVYLCHEDSKSLSGESKAMTNYLKVTVLLKEKTKKSDVKLEAEVIKKLPFLIYLEENATAIGETNRKNYHRNYSHREVNPSKYFNKKNK